MGRHSGKGKKGGRASQGSPARSQRAVRHRWRDYRTASGRRPIEEFLDHLDDEDLASLIAAMKDVRRQGLQAARHLDDEIYEVRADGKGVIYRILFAPQGKRKQVFLSLEAFKKEDAEDPARGDSIGEAQAARLAEARLLTILYLRYQN